MITEQQIEQYINNRNETEFENRTYFNTRSVWSELNPQQKREKAIMDLEKKKILMENVQNVEVKI